jgi:hypothetical protein
MMNTVWMEGNGPAETAVAVANNANSLSSFMYGTAGKTIKTNPNCLQGVLLILLKGKTLQALRPFAA